MRALVSCRRGYSGCHFPAASRSALTGLLLLLPLLIPVATTHAQTAIPAALPDAAPLPDIPTLMRQVEANERAAETLQQNYLYDEANTFDTLDSKDDIKKSSSRKIEVFWLNGVRINRTLEKDGKPLTTDELAKENKSIDERVAKARARRDKADAQGKETDSHGNEEITVARILELGTFSNPRRELVNDRPTIVVDYTGDPKAKTRNSAESAFKELAGTVWIDEQDKSLQHVEGHFNHDFKVAGGLVASVSQGTWFKASWTRVNNEVWLPQSVEADGHARYLVFFSLNGHLQGRTSGYRRFKATSTVLPYFTPVPPAPE